MVSSYLRNTAEANVLDIRNIEICKKKNKKEREELTACTVLLHTFKLYFSNHGVSSWGVKICFDKNRSMELKGFITSLRLCADATHKEHEGTKNQ